MNEEEKGEVEKAVFSEFIEKAGTSIDLTSVKKELPPFPDISCRLSSNEKVWFELAEACAPEFKQAIADLGKAIRAAEESNSPMPAPPAVWGGDVSAETIQKKIRKNYPVQEPVELILYTNGMTAMTDQVLKARIEPILSNGAGQFRRVWLFGEEVHQVWATTS
jgi:hypothetical protein